MQAVPIAQCASLAGVFQEKAPNAGIAAAVFPAPTQLRATVKVEGLQFPLEIWGQRGARLCPFQTMDSVPMEFPQNAHSDVLAE